MSAIDITETIVYANGVATLISISLYWFKEKESCRGISEYAMYVWTACGLIYSLFAMYCALGMRMFNFGGYVFQHSSSSTIGVLQQISEYGLVARTSINAYVTMAISFCSIVYMLLSLYMLYHFRTCLDRTKCNRLYDSTLLSLILYGIYIVCKARHV
jgi:hypothetical protein